MASRFLTFTIAAFSLAGPQGLKATWGSLEAIKRSGTLGLITLAHVGTSYLAFQQLPAGVAMSLFYTYPILNILVGSLFFGDPITLFQIFLIFLAFIGVLLVSFGSAAATTKTESGEEAHVHWKGVAAALAAAATEVAMYFGVKTAQTENPFYATLELYPGAALAGLAGLIASGRLEWIQTDWKSQWLPMTLFNLFVGFVGYSLRFYAIPKIPTIIFSLLSFIGVVSSFAFGWFFVKEVPTMQSILGSALILGASSLA